ncbi:energy transducer TonB [uncultured Bacteroides sp.]|uniref:energy transducer TonB n=1 Tax=uncultured Bacteroides sp. TaxID=162156 RepID=UPI002AAB1D25|nr:energy transducer TonB [uncultured Bacteroides sp.]
MKKTKLLVLILFSLSISSFASIKLSSNFLNKFTQINDTIHQRNSATKRHSVTEVFPQFPGGTDGLQKYIKDNLKYPEISARNKVQGKVEINFVVTKKGAIEKVIVMTSLDKYCDAEAIRLIKNMPKWIPGKINGVPADMHRVISIEFKKNEKEEIKTSDNKDPNIYDEKSECPFTLVEQMPQFPGGKAAMDQFIAKNIKYPELSKNDKISGKVYVRFVVSKEGKLYNAQIMRSLDAYCDKEALIVIRSMPDWIPGKQNGVNVPVYYIVPIAFSLPLQ